MKIDFLWWQGCPSWDRALGILRDEVEAAGLDPETIRVIEITDEADAERHDFPGSPTIRVDGRDIQPVGPDEPRGPTCRVYRRRDGRVSPLPDPADLRQALAAGAEREESAA